MPVFTGFSGVFCFGIHSADDRVRAVIFAFETPIFCPDRRFASGQIVNEQYFGAFFGALVHFGANAEMATAKKLPTPCLAWGVSAFCTLIQFQYRSSA
jgi:hypothetical protein